MNSENPIDSSKEHKSKKFSVVIALIIFWAIVFFLIGINIWFGWLVFNENQ